MIIMAKGKTDVQGIITTVQVKHYGRGGRDGAEVGLEKHFQMVNWGNPEMDWMWSDRQYQIFFFKKSLSKMNDLGHGLRTWLEDGML